MAATGIAPVTTECEESANRAIDMQKPAPQFWGFLDYPVDYTSYGIREDFRSKYSFSSPDGIEAITLEEMDSFCDYLAEIGNG